MAHLFVFNACFTAVMSESSDQHPSTAKDDVPPYAEADVAREQEATSSHCYSIAAISIPPGRDGALEEFPREKLTLKDKLGEGQFGEVSAEVIFYMDKKTKKTQTLSHKRFNIDQDRYILFGILSFQPRVG